MTRSVWKEVWVHLHLHLSARCGEDPFVTHGEYVPFKQYTRTGTGLYEAIYPKPVI